MSVELGSFLMLLQRSRPGDTTVTQREQQHRINLKIFAKSRYLSRLLINRPPTWPVLRSTTLGTKRYSHGVESTSTGLWSTRLEGPAAHLCIVSIVCRSYEKKPDFVGPPCLDTFRVRVHGSNGDRYNWPHPTHQFSSNSIDWNDRNNTRYYRSSTRPASQWESSLLHSRSALSLPFTPIICPQFNNLSSTISGSKQRYVRNYVGHITNSIFIKKCLLESQRLLDRSFTTLQLCNWKLCRGSYR